MVRERELYSPILSLFGEEFSSAENIPLGPKLIDLVLMQKTSEKVIAVEAKVKDWRRALRQAINYQLAADESYVAISKKHANSIDCGKFERTGVGLIVIDLDSGKADIAIPAKESTIKNKNYATLMRAHLANVEIVSQNSQPKSSQQTALKHYLWYVAVERRYYEECSGCYDGFIINAHVLAHSASAFSALCVTLDKPFFIIPDTHFFQLAGIHYFLDTKGGIRSSWEKLAENYGDLVKLVLHQGRRLEPADFVSASGSWQKSMYDFVENVIAFQKSRVPSAVSGLESFFGEAKASEPATLVSPYFFFTSTKDPWYKISVKMAEESTKHKESHRLFALLCTTKEVIMNDQEILTIAQDYSKTDIDGFLIWVQDFNETAETTPLLIGLRQFVEVLKRNNRPVINLHGEFFSSLLCYFGLDGLCYGVCYKESSDPEEFPTGGPPGGPLPKYYFKDLKAKMGKVEAAVALKELPSLKCNCEICSSQLDYMLDAATPNTESRDLMKRHFLVSRKEERDHICVNTLEYVIEELQKSRRRYEGKKAEIVNVEHLKRWISACKTGTSI